MFENPVKDFDEGKVDEDSSLGSKKPQKRKSAQEEVALAASEPALKTEQTVVKVNGEWVVKTQVQYLDAINTHEMLATPRSTSGTETYLLMHLALHHFLRSCPLQEQ